MSRTQVWRETEGVCLNKTPNILLVRSTRSALVPLGPTGPGVVSGVDASVGV